MLSVAQVAKLRALASVDEFPSHFDGLKIRTEEIVTTKPPIQPLVLENERNVDFYEPVHVFGNPIEPSCMTGIEAGPTTLKNFSVRKLSNARIVGNCGVITEDGILYAIDALSNERMEDAVQRNESNHQGYLLFDRQGTTLASYMDREDLIRFPLRVLFFQNLEPNNYGSFIIRQMQSMLALRPFSLDCDAYIVPEVTSWFIEGIGILGLPEKPIYTCRQIAGVSFPEVYICDDIDNEGFILPDLHRQLHSLSKSLDTPNKYEKIFVSRFLNYVSMPTWRVLLNERELISEAERRGYLAVYPETMRLKDQISLFRNARQIVGPSGSGMLNSIFCQEKTKILDLESFTFTVRQHARLYCSSGLEYSFAFGQHVAPDGPLIGRNWFMPKEVMSVGLDWLDGC